MSSCIRVVIFSRSLPATPLSCIIFIWIILGLFQVEFSSIPPVYADGETDHSDSCTARVYRSCWPRRIRPDLPHFTTPMHIPSRCMRAIANRVSLSRRGTMRVEILARFVFANPEGFSDRVQMCVVLFVCSTRLRLYNCAFTVLTRPPTTPRIRRTPKLISLLIYAHFSG